MGQWHRGDGSTARSSFEGGATIGAPERGVCIDDVEITDKADEAMPQCAQPVCAWYVVTSPAYVALRDRRLDSIAVVGVEGAAKVDVAETARCVRSVVRYGHRSLQPA